MVFLQFGLNLVIATASNKVNPMGAEGVLRFFEVPSHGFQDVKISLCAGVRLL